MKAFISNLNIYRIDIYDYNIFKTIALTKRGGGVNILLFFNTLEIYSTYMYLLIQENKFGNLILEYTAIELWMDLNIKEFKISNYISNKYLVFWRFIMFSQSCTGKNSIIYNFSGEPFLALLGFCIELHTYILIQILWNYIKVNA